MKQLLRICINVNYPLELGIENAYVLIKRDVKLRNNIRPHVVSKTKNIMMNLDETSAPHVFARYNFFRLLFVPDATRLVQYALLISG